MRRKSYKEDQKSPVRKIQDDIKETKKHKRKTRFKKIFKRMLVLIFFVSLGFGIYSFDQSPYSKISLIEIEGNTTLSDEFIKEELNLYENDRLAKALYYKFKNKTETEHLAKHSIKMYYTKGKVTLTVEEFPIIGKIPGKKEKLVYSNNKVVTIENKSYPAVFTLTNFTEEILEKYPKFVENLNKVDKASFNSISEIKIIPEPLENLYFQFTMNNGYYVFTNVNNIQLLNHYSDIVSNLEEENRCIYFLDYGHTEETQSAVAKPCDFK